MKKILGIFVVLLTLTVAGCGYKTIPASSLVVLSDQVTILVGTELKIEVSVLPADTSDKTLIWMTVNQDVATVTGDGVITGVTIGDTILTIQVKNTPLVSKEITVHVREEYWPNDEIEEHFGITLPKFPSYSSLTVNHLDQDGLEIILAGYGNEEEVLNQYQTLLLAEGWIAGSTNNDHAGSYTKEGSLVMISYHNSSSHGTKTIELRLSQKTINVSWNDVKEEMEEHFGFELPEFSQYTGLEIKHGQNSRLEIIITGVTDVETTLHEYLELLKIQGWVAGENNDHHMGTYTKEGLNVIMTYHESHHAKHIIEFYFESN